MKSFAAIKYPVNFHSRRTNSIFVATKRLQMFHTNLTSAECLDFTNISLYFLFIAIDKFYMSLAHLFLRFYYLLLWRLQSWADQLKCMRVVQNSFYIFFSIICFRKNLVVILQILHKFILKHKTINHLSKQY